MFLAIIYGLCLVLLLLVMRRHRKAAWEQIMWIVIMTMVVGFLFAPIFPPR